VQQIQQVTQRQFMKRCHLLVTPLGLIPAFDACGACV
jgi:hypothetical protein